MVDLDNLYLPTGRMVRMHNAHTIDRSEAYVPVAVYDRQCACIAAIKTELLSANLRADAALAEAQIEGAKYFAGLKVYKREVDRNLMPHQASPVHSAVARAMDAALSKKGTE